MRIPVFVSCPSPENLTPEQDASASLILQLMKKNNLDWRALGRSDYPVDLPLREVVQMIRHCSGGIILGFKQYTFAKGTKCAGAEKETALTNVAMPTPWNHLEAGIIAGRALPILIFREPGVAGGIFDVGTSEAFIHSMPGPGIDRQAREDLDLVFQRFVGRVRQHYYDE